MLGCNIDKALEIYGGKGIQKNNLPKCIFTTLLSPIGFKETWKVTITQPASVCLSIRISVHPWELFRTHISANAGLIHTNSSLIEVPPCVGVHCHIFKWGVGHVMGSPFMGVYCILGNLYP